MPFEFAAVVFDMDGTLFATEQLAIDALRTAFGEHGLDVPAHVLETVIGRAGKETRAYLNQLAPDGIGDKVLARGSALVRSRIEREGLPLKHGACEILRYLHDRGLPMGLATSTRHASARDNLRRANLDGYFRTVVGGDDVTHPKPHPEVYLRAVRELGVEPARALAVEDSDLGIQAASAAGLRVVHVPDIKRIGAEVKALIYREYPTLLHLRDDLAGQS